MSAAIIPLPGASAVPVVTRKLPPGRPPKNVASIRRGVQLRAQRQARVARAIELEARAREIREEVAIHAAGNLRYVEWLEAEARTLRQQR